MFSRTLLDGVVLGLQTRNILRICDIWGTHCNEIEGMKPYRLVATNVPVKAIACGSYHADGGSVFLWDVANSLTNCTVSHARRLLPLYLSRTKFHTQKTHQLRLHLCVFPSLQYSDRIQESTPESFFSNKEKIKTPNSKIMFLLCFVSSLYVFTCIFTSYFLFFPSFFIFLSSFISFGIPHPPRPALETTQPPIQWVSGYSRR